MSSGKAEVWLVVVLVAVLVSSQAVFGIRFVIYKEECFSHNIEFTRDTIHLSFVVVSVHSSWRHVHNGVDLLVKGTSGEQIEEFLGRTSEKYDFVAHRKGLYSFCFTNKSPHQETIDFDIRITRYYELYKDENIKDEHLSPLLEQIQMLREALYTIEFEQQWLDAQTERQALVNEAMGRWAIGKAAVESAALMGVSGLQVWLLRRLFEKKKWGRVQSSKTMLY